MKTRTAYLAEHVPPATELNLDCMPIEELQSFAVACGTCRCSLDAARRLFPDRPRGYRRAATQLSSYAWNKLTAMRCRGRGEINTALVYERICDRIYSQLPPFAKGW